MTDDDPPTRSSPARLARWVFEDRTTGRIVIAQWPNIPLATYLVATLLGRVDAWPDIAKVARVIATVALLVWAADELLRGVNPWRRTLGAVVLTATVIGLLTR